MRVSIAVLLTLLLLSFASAGCGAPGESAVPGEARTISLEQYRLLREARMELGQFIDEVNQAIQPAVYDPQNGLQPQSLERRAERVGAVIEKYGKKLPEPSSVTTGQVAPGEAAELEGTLTGSMLELDRPLVYMDPEGREQSEPPFAWYVANSYLAALNAVYGLLDFEEYLLEHTADEGVNANRNNPPEQMGANGTRQFGNPGMYGSVGVNITWDPATGVISYQLGPDKSMTSPVATDVPGIEQAFISLARDAFQTGDGTLLEGFKG